MAVEGKATRNQDDFIPVIDEFDVNLDLFAEEEQIKPEDEPKPAPVPAPEPNNDDVILEEEEKEEDGKKEEEKENTTKKSELDEDSMLSATVTLFKDKGIFGKDVEVKSWEELDENVAALPEQIAQSIVDNTSELGKNIIDFIFTSGNRLTEDSLVDFYKTHLQDLKDAGTDINVSSLDSARGFLKGVYSKHYKPSVVEAMLDALEDEEHDGNALIAEATSVKSKLKTAKPKSVTLLERERELNAENTIKQKRFIKALNQEIDQVQWKDSRKNKVKSIISSGDLGKVLKLASQSPRGLMQLADFVDYYDAELQEFDFKAFIAQANSANVKEVKNSMAKDIFSSASSGTKSTKAKNTDVKKGSIHEWLRRT